MPLTQAAKALGVSPTTVRRRVTDGLLAGQRQPHRGGFRWLVLVPTEGDSDPDAAESSTDEPAYEPPPPAGPPANRRVAARDALAEMRETDESLRELAARVDLASREVIHFVERERSFALVQADRLEEAAREAERAEQRAERAPHLRVIEHTEPPELADASEGAHDSEATDAAVEREAQGESGSVRALLLSCAVLVAMVAVSFVALPAWTNGIVASVGVVAGLIAVVELFLVVSRWVGARHQRSIQ